MSRVNKTDNHDYKFLGILVGSKILRIHAPGDAANEASGLPRENFGKLSAF